MGAPKGNNFWQLRLKHGRDHKIKTPQELWDNFVEYSEWIEKNPLEDIDYKGKDATRVKLPKLRAMTKDHFALSCGLSGWEIIHEYRERSKDFSEIVTRIEKYIYYQKFAGSAAGLFNPNIIARELGLTDKQEVNTKSEKVIIKMPSLDRSRKGNK